MFRHRTLVECNYRGVFENGKTLRIALDPSKPICELTWPEFYDVKITDYCTGGCPWCYMDSTAVGKHVPDALDKIDAIFGAMEPTKDGWDAPTLSPTPACGIRPFQVALGGGNPNEHPDFCRILELFWQLGIVPNYTTNGMVITDEVIDATRQFCGGVAVSCHPHLEMAWHRAVSMLLEAKIPANLHVIISDLPSIFRLHNVIDCWAYWVDHIILLPYTPQGRAPTVDTDFDTLFRYLRTVVPKELLPKIAFGAGFHERLKANPWLKTSLYEPEAMSKYVDLANNTLYPSSFLLQPLKVIG